MSYRGNFKKPSFLGSLFIYFLFQGTSSSTFISKWIATLPGLTDLTSGLRERLCPRTGVQRFLLEETDQLSNEYEYERQRYCQVKVLHSALNKILLQWELQDLENDQVIVNDERKFMKQLSDLK